MDSAFFSESVVIASGVVLVLSLSTLYVLRMQRLKSVETPISGKVQKFDSVSKAVKSSGKITIFYGTQTGTAENFAQELCTKLEENFDTEVEVKDLEDVGNDLDSAEETLMSSSLSVVICATYGDGEPPDTVAIFYEWLKGLAEDCDSKMDDEKPLKGMKFCCFGLGNTTYEFYNHTGKTLNALLEQCGGNRLLEVGLGNDEECIEEDFQKWVDELLPVIKSAGIANRRCSTSNDEHAQPTPDSIPAFLIIPETMVKPPPPQNASNAYDANIPYLACVSARRELQGKESSRSTLHVEIDIKPSGLSYTTGDHLGVYPENDPEVVCRMAERLGVFLTDVIRVEEPPTPASDPRLQNQPTNGNLNRSSSGRKHSYRRASATLNGVEVRSNPLGHFGPLTVHTALARYCDLLTPPKKAVLASLAVFCTSAHEAEQLRLLASVEGKDQYHDWIHRDHRSLLEVMMAFPSAQVPLGTFLCSIAPRLQVRYYSISSSSLCNATNPSLTVAVVNGKTPTGRIHHGVASTWLGKVAAHQPAKVPVFIRPSSFRLPSSHSSPLVMVGPGTGLAPFRGFLQERHLLKQQGKELGEALLFFGCRNQDDYIYSDELQEFLSSGALTELRVAFSRMGASKVYVQHQMKESGASVWELMGKKRGSLYVCGDAKHMARDVHKAVLEIIQEQSKVTEKVAEVIVKGWQEASRYQRDVW